MMSSKPTLDTKTPTVTVSVKDIGVDCSDVPQSPASTLISTSEKITVVSSEVEREADSASSATSNPHSCPTLPPKDEGFQAWKMLLLAICAEAPLLGFPLSYGIFQNHYNEQFLGNTTSPWIGVLVNGIYFLAAPVMTHLCQTVEIKRQVFIFAGWALCVSSMLGSAFCPSLPGLIVLQGALYGIGLLLIEMPLLMILNTWFDRRRGLAYGLLFAASDTCGFVWAFMEDTLLHKSGHRVTVLVMSALILGICGPAMFFLRERPTATTMIIEMGTTTATATRNRNRRASVISQASLPATPTDTTIDTNNKPRRKFYKRPIFYIIAFTNFFTAFSCELPFIYLPSAVQEMGYSAQKGTTILALGILAQVVGELCFGELSDRIPVTYLVIMTTAGASLSTFLLWGLGKTFVLMILFALLFGSLTSGFIALWARLGMLFGEDDAAMVYSTLCTGRGIGVIASGPISSIIVSQWRQRSELTVVLSGARFGAGRYTGLIIVVGSSLALATLLGVAAVFALWGRMPPQPEEQEAQEGDQTAIDFKA